ncbi:MAG: CHAT domain-containing protein [Acidobacteria bacterium]|nr:CHAT domain-containing protein [Acidobacteriota bacterium]
MSRWDAAYQPGATPWVPCFQVRFLEVGHPDQIGNAFASDNFHILHISCHGSPDSLQLEDEDGNPFATTSQRLTDALSGARSLAPPLVFLNSCKSGADNMAAASFSENLLRRGIPLVIAMLTNVTDYYATRLAAEFYKEITRGEPKLASRALARARERLEIERQERLRQATGGESSQEYSLPEYATATLFVAGEESPLVDLSSGNTEPLKRATELRYFGDLPALDMDQLIGRRRELREAIRLLRDQSSTDAGIILTGVGGIGKSALAGRIAQRMFETHFLIGVHYGKLSLQSLCKTIGKTLKEEDSSEKLANFGNELLKGDSDEIDLSMSLIRVGLVSGA